MTGSTAVRGTYFRFLTHRWSHRPLSGDGAAVGGGRYNRPERPALYMSEDVATAWDEYSQAGALMRPGTLVAYGVEAAAIVD